MLTRHEVEYIATFYSLRGTNLSYINLCGADLSGANLSDTNLRNADLSGANLRRADLSGADLSEANLRGADLCGADLSDANLRRADLCGADLHATRLFNTTGNSVEIRTLQTEYYIINFCGDRIQIGCLNYSKEEWFSFTEEEINKMEDNTLKFWNKYKEVVKCLSLSS
jgi:hypothetical protein